MNAAALYTGYMWRLGRHNKHSVYAVTSPRREEDTFLFTTGRGQEQLAKYIVDLHNDKIGMR